MSLINDITLTAIIYPLLALVIGWLVNKFRGL